jgi:hypothetical protein
MHSLIIGVVFLAWLVAIVCAVVTLWTAVPAVAGVSGAFGPFMGSLIIGLGALWVANTLTDYEQPPEVKALKAAEDALRTRREEAREKKRAVEEDRQAAEQLDARRKKLKEDLEWERIENDPVAKAKFEADRASENMQKRRDAVEAENSRVAMQCDRELETWPERSLPMRCSAPQVRNLMRIAPQEQARLAREAAEQSQEQIDRADAQRCDVYFQSWPNGRAWARCSAPELQRFMHTRLATPTAATIGR